MTKVCKKPAVHKRRHLKETNIKQKTLDRYHEALHRFYQWLRRCRYRLPRDVVTLDFVASEFINSLWEDHAPHAWASLFLSALSRLVPAASAHLATSRRWMRNWTGTLRRKRALPLSQGLVDGIVGAAVLLDEPRTGLMIAVGFAGLLRTDEIISLTPRQIRFGRQNRTAMLTYENTKTSRWKNSAEVVQIKDPALVRYLHFVSSTLPADEAIYPHTAPAFNTALRRFARIIGLEHDRLSAYSLRRGGAAEHFARGGSYDKACEAGRWAQLKTARTYIDGALTDLAASHISEDDLRFCHQVACFARTYIRVWPGMA